MTQVVYEEASERLPKVATRWNLYGSEVLADIELRELPPGTGAAPAVRVTATTMPPPLRRTLVRQTGGQRGTPVIQLFQTPSGYFYDVEGIACFWIDSAGEKVEYHLSPGASLADFEHFLAGPVLGIAYQLRGGIALHAGAVVVGGKAIGFAAPHGFGKSTLAATLSTLGLPLLTDDVLPLRKSDAGWFAVHSLPRVKLWEDSLAALGHQPENFEHVTSWVPKRRVPIGSAFGTIAPDTAQLGTIYILDPRIDDIEFSVATLNASDAVFALMANLYMPEALTTNRAARTFSDLCSVVETVPVRRISYQRTFETIATIRDCFLADADRTS
jgi:hypothetical protein